MGKIRKILLLEIFVNKNIKYERNIGYYRGNIVIISLLDSKNAKSIKKQKKNQNRVNFDLEKCAYVRYC